MKKFLPLIIAILFSFKAMAQLPDGSIAPDFTATDINGQTWNLYDILNSGKTVVMDISATWCGPCWAFHETHALDDLYAAHGPTGDDKVVVLFIEGDASTETACLYDQAGCTGGTLGNWVAGSNYPIIDNGSLSDLFAISGFPTIYMICPDKTIREVPRVSGEEYWEMAQECAVQFGVNNAGILGFESGSDGTEICGPTPAAPSFNLTNMGSSPLTSATIKLIWNGTTLQTINWTGNLPVYAADVVNFDQLIVDQTGDLVIEVSNVNNTVDEDLTNNTKTVSYISAPTFNKQKVVLKIKTDQYGDEMYWEMRDDQGNVLDHGGNEAVGPDGGGQFPNGSPASPTAYGANQTLRDTLVLPDNGCYSMYFVDAYGDGLCCTYGAGYYKMYNVGSPANVLLEGAEYGETESRAFGIAGITNVEDLVPSADFDIYPNPTAAQLTVDFVLNEPSAVQINVVNALGQTVRTLPNKLNGAGFHTEYIQVSNLPNGIYLLNLRTTAGMVSKKFTVNHGK